MDHLSKSDKKSPQVKAFAPTVIHAVNTTQPGMRYCKMALDHINQVLMVLMMLVLALVALMKGLWVPQQRTLPICEEYVGSMCR